MLSFRSKEKIILAIVLLILFSTAAGVANARSCEADDSVYACLERLMSLESFDKKQTDDITFNDSVYEAFGYREHENYLDDISLTARPINGYLLSSEPLMLGDEASLIIREKKVSPANYQVNVTEDYKHAIKNYDKEWVSEYSIIAITRVGTCIIRRGVESHINGEELRKFHPLLSVERGQNGPFYDYEITNLHPESDHGKKDMIDGVVASTEEIIKEIQPYCEQKKDKVCTSYKYQDAECLDKCSLIVVDTPERYGELTDCITSCNRTGCQEDGEPTAVENISEVEALAEKRPTAADFQLPPGEKASPNITMMKLDGLADFQLPDGTWMPIKEGDMLPEKGTLQTQYGSTAELNFSDGGVIIIGPLTDFNIKEFLVNPQSYRTRLDLGTGEARFDVLQGDYDTDMQVSPPNSTASPAGTDFAVAYDKNTGIAIYEIYDGTLNITSKLTGEKKVITSSYGQPIERIEVAKDGAMTEQIAIPKDEWRARKAEAALQAQSKERRGNRAFWILLILALGGGITFLYKKGKLKPLIQKASALIQRNKNKPL